MSNLAVINLNGGEFSPKIDARADTEKYASGCRRLENMIPKIYGPVEKRPGTELIAISNEDGTYGLPGSSVNDFSGDANCKAVWNLDNGALTTDSKGTNTLTNSGVTADTGDFKEGDASGGFNSDQLSITDASLDAGFPLKSGDANKKISVSFWMKINAKPTGLVFWACATKWSSSGSKRSFGAFVSDQGSTVTRVSLLIGFNGGASTEIILDTTVDIVADRWYHVGVTFQDSDKSFRIRIWDDTAQSVTETTGNSTNNINIEDAGFELGSADGDAFSLNGKLDEVVVFNDILSSGEIDKIRNGTYP